jgi:hypothetical protein
MGNAVDKKQWRIIASSVEGATHKRNGKPNQDRIKFFIDDQSKFPVILAVLLPYRVQKMQLYKNIDASRITNIVIYKYNKCVFFRSTAI